MKTYGLIGKTLKHSFSKKYFTKKFQKEAIQNCRYELFPLATIADFPTLIKQQKDLNGLNVTIPYKEVVLPYLDEIDTAAAAIGAVNTIQFNNGRLKGFNTDIIGFANSLKTFLQKNKNSNIQALILGTGGAAKAVKHVLEYQFNIPHKIVSRNPQKGDYTYNDLDKKILETHHLIINTTPLGTYPAIENCPNIPYSLLGAEHFLYDLVYNPEITLFLKKGMEQNAQTINGLDMLIGQAEAAWKIWNL